MSDDPWKMISLAYGFLWNVHGDASKDRNIRLAYAARHALLSVLNRDEQLAGIEQARAALNSKVSWTGG